MSYRAEKLREALRETAAEFLSREAGRQSLVTVTGVRLRENEKSADILITVYPDAQEKDALSFANRKRADFLEYFKKRIRGVAPPRVEFVIDRGEKNRQRLDEISQ